MTADIVHRSFSEGGRPNDADFGLPCPTDCVSVQAGVSGLLRNSADKSAHIREKLFLNRCAVAPLRRCTAAPLYLCTFVPLHLCTVVPLYR